MTGSAQTDSAVASRSVAPQTRIGHVHLKVADLERAIAFYNGVLGFDVTQRYGRQAAFLSAGGYHITSASIPGKAPAAPRPRLEPRVCITMRSCTRGARR